MLRKRKKKFFRSSFRLWYERLNENYLTLNSHRPWFRWNRCWSSWCCTQHHTKLTDANRAKNRRKKKTQCVSVADGMSQTTTQLDFISRIISNGRAVEEHFFKVESKSYLHISICLFCRIEKYEHSLPILFAIPSLELTHIFTRRVPSQLLCIHIESCIAWGTRWADFIERDEQQAAIN